jgi:starch synthase (maltosyl-transferring)
MGNKFNGTQRVIIESIAPQIDSGRFPVKRTIGECVVVEADVFGDGHDRVAASMLYKKEGAKTWTDVPMRHIGNDRWQASFVIEKQTPYLYTVQGWIDHFSTWYTDTWKKQADGQSIDVEMKIGHALVLDAAKRARGKDAPQCAAFAGELVQEDVSAAFGAAGNDRLQTLMQKYIDPGTVTRSDLQLRVWVDRPLAKCSAWYELFPRSCGKGIKHGTFKDCEAMLPRIAAMGFDVLYLPPIHPVGKKNRKGKNNAVMAKHGDPGSPWAIGSSHGGHKSINPLLGTIDDFTRLIKHAADHGLEIAMDIAFQCAPDHPYITEHPEWFKYRPDGSIQYAENPPKKYEDIVPIHFESDRWKPLWDELKSIVEYWIGFGVKLFRIDNPHTKPFVFWEWMIGEIQREYPDVLFLAEAFTRPKAMKRLAKAGFSQSYTYFTWRNTKQELIDYMTELTQSDVREYFRPNFWPNTPDILPEYLQYGGRPAFIVRLCLAATLSSNYGIYGPAFELCVADALPEREEYADSEKYEIKQWNLESAESLEELITRINRVRRENSALADTNSVRFYDVDNEALLFYGKINEHDGNAVFVAVNLDPYHTQSGWVKMPLWKLGIDPSESYLMHDCIGEGKYIWQGEYNYIELNPHILPVHIFRLRRRLKRETDFDYFM